MHAIIKKGLLLLALVLPLLLAGCGEQDKSAPPKGGKYIGQPAPDFTLADMQGQKVTLAQLKGKVVLLNFWATWCPPCREEMPSMERLHQQFKDQGLVMLAVNVEDNGFQAVTSFLNQTPYSFPILLDRKAEVQNLYQVFRFPETLLIDRNGVVVDRLIGGRDWMSKPLVKKINFLLNG
ncbi:MAG TPA: TlpA disulfide reductase family protein [Malonomonas sp.]